MRNATTSKNIDDAAMPAIFAVILFFGYYNQFGSTQNHNQLQPIWISRIPDGWYVILTFQYFFEQRYCFYQKMLIVFKTMMT